ncbi:hypothetical protein RI129_000720 [Pyrocoelia pectoralis]|uniref:Protein zwilch n=1 Tax=Pyrocoelia pectoralis TaxID=417401 RepID=A0AAN7VS16_9COLE
MDKCKGLVVRRAKLPSYLVTLLETENDVLLVSAKNKEAVNVTQDEEIDVSCCNLTGNPLDVDLTVLLDDATVTETTENKEEEYTPISLNLAREFINHYNESINNEGEMVVCLCDGEDAMDTTMLASVQIGGNFVRMMAFADHCTAEADMNSNLDHLLNYHIQNVGVGPHKVDTHVLCFQNLYGYKLFDYHLDEYCEHLGSVQMESSWNMLQCNIPEHGATIKVMLQVIAGHEDSVIYTMFQELQFLKYCLDELSNNKMFENVNLSSVPMESEELCQSICDVLRSVHVYNVEVPPRYVLFDFDRDANLTDKLWNIFKCCGTVNELSNCFQKLFETIASESLILQDDRNSILGEMIQDLCSGKMSIIPHLSLKQCLELFIELGLQKLKKNYFTIIKSFNFQIAKDLQDKWNTLHVLPSQTGRSTFTGLNVLHGVTHLHLLYRIHSAIECLLLVREKCHFSEDILTSVLKSVLNKYVMNTVSDFCYGSKQLCDITVHMCFADIKDYYLNCFPNKWRIRMSSDVKNASVITSFHYTRKPLFLDTIYKYDHINNSASEEGPRLYVTRLETYSDKVN